MTAYAPVVNVEALVLDILRDSGINNAHAERVGTGVPYVLVEAAGGQSDLSDNPGWVQTSDIQISSWGNTKGEALDLFNAASLALRSYVRTAPVRPQGVLTKARIPRPNWSPDDDVLIDGNPAPRYFAVATVTVHP